MKQRYLPARFGYTALTALLTLFAAAPASANSCADPGNWRGGAYVTIRANVVDASDGWKVTERTFKAAVDAEVHAENVRSGDIALRKDYEKLWARRALLVNGYDKKKEYKPMVNTFETTFEAADGTRVACTAEFRGREVYNVSRKFFGVTCSGPDSSKEYVSCRRQYGDSADTFRVWLTLNDLD